jgi:hypothetical protein
MHLTTAVCLCRVLRCLLLVARVVVVGLCSPLPFPLSSFHWFVVPFVCGSLVARQRVLIDVDALLLLAVGVGVNAALMVYELLMSRGLCLALGHCRHQRLYNMAVD